MTRSEDPMDRAPAGQASSDDVVASFRIAIPERDLADLKARLRRTRWPVRLPGEDWKQGVPVRCLQELTAYWLDRYDWREHEARLNRLPQYTTRIDGQLIHFVHVKSPEPDALPLILTHGWPGSIVDFARIAVPLADPRAYGAPSAQAFHVVAPSVPGFAFSEAPPESGWTFDRVADIWAKLMGRIGYDRYGAQGGDFGAYVAPELARIDAGHLVGVHINSGLGFPSEEDIAAFSEAEQADFAGMMGMMDGGGFDHARLMTECPQTFSYGWSDSPTALLALMMEKYRQYAMVERPEEALDLEDILTNISLYWLTDTFGTSGWIYRQQTGPAWPANQALVPTGLYSGGPGWMRRIAERDNRIVHWPEDNPGGHLPALEQPESFVRDIRTFFGRLPLDPSAPE